MNEKNEMIKKYNENYVCMSVYLQIYWMIDSLIDCFISQFSMYSINFEYSIRSCNHHEWIEIFVNMRSVNEKIIKEWTNHQTNVSTSHCEIMSF